MDTTYIVRSVSYLDLHLKIDNEGWLRTKRYDKIDDFNFSIVNIPFICSNIPATPAYGVYISQLIQYSRSYGSYHDFLDRGLLKYCYSWLQAQINQSTKLTRKLLNQEFLLVKSKSSLRTFYGRHHDLVNRYSVSVSLMITDMFRLS